MGIVGAATVPLWLPQVYGVGLAPGGNPAVRQFTNYLRKPFPEYSKKLQIRDNFKKFRKYIKTLNHMYGKDVKRIGLEYATGQGLERIGDFMMKHTIGMDSDQASYKLLSPLVEPLDITAGQKEGLYRIGSQYVNPGNWVNPSKRLVNGYIIDDMYNFTRLPYDWFTNQK